MGNEAFYDFLLAAFQNTEAAMAKDASIYVFHADTEGLNFRRAFSDAGFYLSGTCIWKKQSLVLGRSPYQWQHEPVLLDGKRKASISGIQTASRPPSGSLRNQRKMATIQP